MVYREPERIAINEMIEAGRAKWLAICEIPIPWASAICGCEYLSATAIEKCRFQDYARQGSLTIVLRRC